MNRKILFIITGALLFLALLALLWFWFLHRSPAANTGNPSGFATSTDRNSSGTNPGGTGNTPNNTQQNQGGAGVQGGLDGVNIIGSGIDTTGSGINTSGSSIDTGPQGTTPNPRGSTSTTTLPGVTTGAWLGSNVSERIFNPSDIADLNNPGPIGGTPFISTTPQPAGLGTSGIVIGAAAAGCLAQYLLYEGSALLQTNTTDRVQSLGAGPYVVVFDFNASAKQNNTKFKSVEECLVKTIARAAIDQITRSVVSWINSGFNGQPSFVTNYNQYFANVADQAASEFIKSSALSFLCSPFAPQIKIAIAQSYANRNGGGSGASCSLTKVTNNVNNFLKGNWAAGGWGGLLQFTTMPTNNPYGAYAYAEISLSNSIARAQNNAGRNVSPGGFISIQKCDTSKGQTPGSGNCPVTTPGSFIEESLKQSSIKGPVDGLNLAQNINDIINALTNQVMIKAIYGGLGGSLGSSITNPLAPAIDQGASAQAKALLASLQASASAAAQYGSVKQGSASDIQQVQQNFNSLYNCWQTVASSTALTTSQQAQGAQGAASANVQILQLQAQVDALNTDITRANTAIASIQNLQSQVLFAATPEDVTAAGFAVQAATPSLISAADVTTAQQNRATLQTQLTATNQQAQTSMTQCRAIMGV